MRSEGGASGQQGWHESRDVMHVYRLDCRKKEREKERNRYTLRRKLGHPPTLA